MIGTPAGRRRRGPRFPAFAGAVALFSCLAVPVPAEVLPYTIEIPDGRPVQFEIEFEVEHPGRLSILADWSGSRIVSFRLERTPGRVHEARRSGPSPQRIDVVVDPWDLERDPVWTLTIRAPSGRGAASGTVTLQLPEPVETDSTEIVETSTAPPPPSAPPAPEAQQAWERPKLPPPGASKQEIHLFSTIENFRVHAVAANAGTVADACRWQAGLLEYLAGWRDELVSSGEIPPISSRRYLVRLTEAIRDVETLRSSDDPILAGPVPEDSMRRRAWTTLRRQKIEPLERELDALAHMVGTGHAPELEGQTWPQRLLSCLAACERHFEQRVRVGADRAVNHELAGIQWQPVLAAGEALEALVFLAPPDVPAREREVAELDAR